eukprot:1256046-Prymnesium_polylepis.1
MAWVSHESYSTCEQTSNRAIRQSSNQAIRAIKQSDNQAIRQSSNQAIKGDGRDSTCDETSSGWTKMACEAAVRLAPAADSSR